MAKAGMTGTKEWAKHNLNFAKGCQHDCCYCYAKSMAARVKRVEPESWKEEVVLSVNPKALMRRYNGRIMIPSSHDITPNNIETAVEVIETLLVYGNELLIVSKPHMCCIDRLIPVVKNYKAQVTFRFTIGSCSDEVLRFWEPGAPCFRERFDCLKRCYEEGLNTSVSSEPMLDTNTRELVEILRPYVTDAIWIGLPNGLRQKMSVNHCTSPVYRQAVDQLLHDLSKEYVLGLHKDYKDDPLIKWKESIKRIVGASLVQIAGEDR